MKRSGRSMALAVVGVLFWILAIAHPWVYLQDREAVLRARPKSNFTPLIYTLLSQADALHERLRSSEVIGYVSEGDFDLRVGGALQGRYYLAQYALAPTLLEREVDLGREPSDVQSLQSESHELVLACFRRPRQLKTYLARTSRQSILTLSPKIALTLGRED